MEGRKEARKQKKAEKQEEARRSNEEGEEHAWEPETPYGNHKHRHAVPSGREPETPFRELKTPTGAQHTIPETSNPNLGTENTPARELKTPWEPPNPPGNRKHHSGKKTTTGTRNTFPGTRNPEPPYGTSMAHWFCSCTLDCIHLAVSHTPNFTLRRITLQTTGFLPTK